MNKDDEIERLRAALRLAIDERLTTACELAALEDENKRLKERVAKLEGWGLA